MKCEKGHFYDRALFLRCPHCENDLMQPVNEVKVKQEIARYALEYIQEYRMEEPASELRFARQNVIEKPAEEKIAVSSTGQDVKTAAFSIGQQKNYFVTGWLVCVGGPDRGHTFNLYYGYNTVGYSRKNQICLLEDTKIARKVHCSIVYDDRKNRFCFVPEENHPSYLNGDLCDGEKELRTGDRIMIGESDFDFIAFCEGDRKWTREEMRKNISF